MNNSINNRVILQSQVTLDDAVLAMSIFPNGCDFRLIMEGKQPFLEYGCYGAHTNLTQGKRRLLMNWLGNEEKKALPISQETLAEILKREPCKRCGGTRFKHDNQ